jgi:hypothetical protein
MASKTSDSGFMAGALNAVDETFGHLPDARMLAGARQAVTVPTFRVRPSTELQMVRARYRPSGKVHCLNGSGELAVRCLPGNGRPVRPHLWDLTDDPANCLRCLNAPIEQTAGSLESEEPASFAASQVIDIQPLEGGSLGYGMPDPPNDWYSILSDAARWYQEHTFERPDDPHVLSASVQGLPSSHLRNYEQLVLAFSMLDGWIQRTGRLPAAWGGRESDGEPVRWDPT